MCCSVLQWVATRCSELRELIHCDFSKNVKRLKVVVEWCPVLLQHTAKQTASQHDSLLHTAAHSNTHLCTMHHKHRNMTARLQQQLQIKNPNTVFQTKFIKGTSLCELWKKSNQDQNNQMISAGESMTAKTGHGEREGERERERERVCWFVWERSDYDSDDAVLNRRIIRVNIVTRLCNHWWIIDSVNKPREVCWILRGVGRTIL